MAHQFGHNPEIDGRWLALTDRVYVEGARWLDRVLDACPTPEAVLESTPSCIAASDLEALKQTLSAAAQITLPEALTGPPHGLWIVTPRDIEYPPLLRECSDRPPFLFAKGDPRLLGMPMLSIVGTRKPSLDGRRAATEFATAAVQAHFCVASGLALGIDSIVHDAAMRADGLTVAVLPSGIDQVYPRRHEQLARRIAGRGVLVSEFPLRSPPRRHHFHRRNRTLSGLSGSTLVIEAGRPSGTLLTASAAADQGRNVLVLPWSIYHTGGAGCHYLLRDGAELVQSVEDLFACLGVRPDSPASNSAPTPVGAESEGPSASVLESDQQRVMLLLGRGVHRAEDIATSMGWDMNRCLSCLSGLEVLGSVVRMPEGYSAAH